MEKKAGIEHRWVVVLEFAQAENPFLSTLFVLYTAYELAVDKFEKCLAFEN